MPLRRCACSGPKAVCAAHSGPSVAASARRPWLRCSLRRRLRPAAPPGSAGRSPSGSPPALWLRLSGRAAPVGPVPPSPRRPLCGSGCGLRRFGLARFALGSPGRPWAAPGSCVALCAAAGFLAPPGRLAASGPPSRPRLIRRALRPAGRLRLRLPGLLRPGGLWRLAAPWAAPAPRPGVWGVPPLRRRAREPPCRCPFGAAACGLALALVLPSSGSCRAAYRAESGCGLQYLVD